VSNSPDSVLADLLRRFDSRRPLRRHFNTVVENAIAAHGDLSIPRAYYSAASVYLAWGSGERVLGTDSEFVRYRPRLSQPLRHLARHLQRISVTLIEFRAAARPILTGAGVRLSPQKRITR
jgi:hypothetical protein